jgi:hypothetical protein
VPALPAVPKVLRVALTGTMTGSSPWLTRFYLQYTGTAPTNAQLITLCGTMATAYNADLKSLAHADVVMTGQDIIDLSSPTSAVAIDTFAGTGTRAGTVNPAQACLVLSYEIARRYRGGHPRGYWPFGDASDLTDPGHWTGAFTSACATGFASFFAAMVAGGWTGAGTITQVNVSYYSGFTVVTSPTTGRARNVPTLRVTPLIDAVTSIVPRTSVGTQRRREGFVA